MLRNWVDIKTWDNNKYVIYHIEITNIKICFVTINYH